MGICKLCKNERVLLKKSHIYPNFVYADLFDEHGKLRKFDASEMKKLNPKISRPASGTYEGNLLCDECDNKRISRLESYVAELLNGKDKNVDCELKKTDDGTEIIEVRNLKYPEFKNFILSLLFRADISTFSEFDEVRLGPYNEKMRIIVYDNLSTEDLEYQVNIFKLSDDSNFNTLIGQPVKSKIGAETVYSILMKGHLIVISLKENITSKKVKDIRLKSDGTIRIPMIPKKIEREFILNYFGLT